MKPQTPASFLIIALFACTASAQEWTRLRGPNGSGVSDAKTVPVKFTESDFNWKVKLPGEGYGSPVIWGDKLFVQSGDQKTGERHLLCLSTKDGSKLWANKYAGKTFRHHQFNALGASTPAVDADLVYAYFGDEEKTLLIAVKHDGEEAWRKDLGVFKSKHGPGTSPMLHENLVIVTSDQDAESFIAAYDRKTGEQKWKLPRKFSGNGASYGVPCVFQHKGDKPQIIFGSANHGMTSVDPAAGKVIWELGDLMPLRVVACLVVSGDTIVISCGEGGGGKKFAVVRPGTTDGKTKPEVVWSTVRGIPYVPTAIALGEHLYTVTDGGMAGCMNAKTGDVIWQERLDDTFFGSPVCVDGKIYIMSRKGDVCVFRASPEKFELLARNPLGEKSFATPSVAGGRMYLRTATQLICVGGRDPNTN